MTDPFKPALVYVAALLNNGASWGPFAADRPDVVEFMLAFSSRDLEALNNVFTLAHNQGLCAVDINQIASVQITSGDANGVRELVELVGSSL